MRTGSPQRGNPPASGPAKTPPHHVAPGDRGMKRPGWLFALLVVGVMLPRFASAQIEAPIDTLSDSEATLEGAVLLPEPEVGPAEDLASPEGEAPLSVDEPALPDEEVSQVTDEDLGDFQVQEADADALVPVDIPAVEADDQVVAGEEEEPAVEAPDIVVAADDDPEDPEVLATGDGVEVEEIVLPPGLELYAPPSPEEVEEEYPAIDESPATPELPAELGQPPVLPALPSPSVDEGQTLEFAVPASDPDPGQTVAVHASSLPEGASFDGTTFSWAPSYVQSGTYTVAFAAVDDGPLPQLSPEQVVTITVRDVNQPPMAADDSLVTGEDQAAAPLDFRANDVDLDGDEIVVTGVTSGSGATVTRQEDGTYVYAPLPDFNGPDSLSYTVSDGRGGSGTGTVRVTVTAVNDPPRFAVGLNQVVDEDAGPQTVAGWATGISPGPPDEAGQALVFAVSGVDTALFAVQPAVSADGTLTYTPAPQANGIARLAVGLRDDGGSAAAGAPTVDGAAPGGPSFTITINPVNDPPVVTVTPTEPVDEGQPLTFQARASDVDGVAVISVDGLPAGATLVDNHDGTATFHWTPGYDQAGVHTVTVAASDGELSTRQSVVLTVLNVTRSVAATTGGHGSITPSGPTPVDYGSDQTFAIAAAPGYRVDEVLVDGVAIGPVDAYTFRVVSADHSIEAHFAINTFSLTATAGPGGGIAPAGVTTVTYGGSQTYTATASEGYALGELRVDGVPVSPADHYTFSGVAADHAIAVSFVDVAPPVIALIGADPLLLELGTPYPELGATAIDQADGDLTDRIRVSGAIDPNTEGTYTLTYTAADAAGNSGSASRTVRVVVTPNSYGLIATHSMDLRAGARLNSGFAGVVDRGQRPFLAGRTELVVGTDVQTAPEVRLSAPRVVVRDRARVGGRLVYNELSAVGRRASIGARQQVGTDYFPLFKGFGLPVFQSGNPGAREVDVKQRGATTLAAGAYGQIRVRERGVLTLSGGTYQLADLEVGQLARLVFLGPTVLLVKGQLALAERAAMAPAAGVTAADIRVFVEGREGRLGLTRDDRDGNDEEDDAEGRGLRLSPRAVQIGQDASFQGNLYAPGGTVDLRQGAGLVGAVIARDIIVGVRAQVAAQSGWQTPGVIFQPSAGLPLAKPAAEAAESGTTAAQPAGTGLHASYPNPFNPSITVPYTLAQAGVVNLTVFNLLGQPVRVLVDQLSAAGSYQARWDGRDAAGAPVAGGVYLIRLQNGDRLEVDKVLLAK